MLELRDLARRYGDVVALDGTSFTVAEGQMFGFVALIPLAARIYSGGILRTGSALKLRDAWRASRA